MLLENCWSKRACMDHENLRSTTPSMPQELAARYHLLAVLIKKALPTGGEPGGAMSRIPQGQA